MTIDATAYLAFLMAMVRAGAWVAVAPPFNHHSIPVTVRAGAKASISTSQRPRQRQGREHQVVDIAGRWRRLWGG